MNNNIYKNMVGHEIVVNKEQGWALEWGQCPWCNGIFGVDVTFLDEVTLLLDCPLCGEPVRYVSEE